MVPYILYFLVVVVLSWTGRKNKTARFILFVVASLFMGLRDGIGVDFETYKERYELELYYFEPGYNFLCHFLHQNNLSVHVLFLILAFGTYFFIYLYLEKINEKQKLYPIFAILFYFFTFTIICNVVRQCFAASVFLYSTTYIRLRRIFPFFFLILLGGMFHYAMFICLPLYWVSNYKITKRISWIIYCCSFLFCFLSLDQMVGFIIPYLNDFKWVNYMDSEHYAAGYISLGVLLDIIILLLCFHYSLKVRLNVLNPLIFNLFLISIITYNMKVGSILMVRINLMFSWFLYVVFSYILQYINNKETQKLLTFIVMLYMVVTFVQYVFLDSSSCLYPYRDVLGIWG